MKLTLSYQPQQLPPPFAYAAVMQIETQQQEVLIDFSLEYLDRDSVSDDELRAEGFTRQDDFSWSGSINSAWADDIEALIEMEYHEKPDNEIYLHVSRESEGFGFPSDIKKADLLFQELMQAVLERMQIERTLVVECNLDNSNFRLEWVFAERSVELNHKASVSWNAGRELLNLIFSLDFDSLSSGKKAKDASVNIGDGLWYDIQGTGIVNQLKKLLN